MASDIVDAAGLYSVTSLRQNVLFAPGARPTAGTTSRPPPGVPPPCTYTGSWLRLSTIDAYALTTFAALAVTRIDSTLYCAPPIDGKSAVSADCEKLLPASGRLATPMRFALPSKSSSVTLTG